MAAHIEQQQQPWTITLRAKARNLDFKFKLLKNLPVCQLFRFSFHFKRRHYTLAIKSKPKSSFSLNRTSFKLKKFLRIFKKFQVQRSENKGIAKLLRSHKKTLCSVIVMGWSAVVYGGGLLRSFASGLCFWERLGMEICLVGLELCLLLMGFVYQFPPSPRFLGSVADPKKLSEEPHKENGDLRMRHIYDEIENTQTFIE
ncbi:hypothetical protein OROMI_011768 [Orobanche minor]